MDRIGRAFNEEFSRWDICLPPVAIISKQSGRIVKRGWTVWYTFGSDEGTDYLDYYASHRMTNDRHTRLYADGRSEDLEVMHSGYVVPKILRRPRRREPTSSPAIEQRGVSLMRRGLRSKAQYIRALPSTITF